MVVVGSNPATPTSHKKTALVAVFLWLVGVAGLCSLDLGSLIRRERIRTASPPLPAGLDACTYFYPLKFRTELLHCAVSAARRVRYKDKTVGNRFGQRFLLAAGRATRMWRVIYRMTKLSGTILDSVPTAARRVRYKDVPNESGHSYLQINLLT